MRVDPPVVAASLSGESDGAWARRASPYVGAAFLGGIALDDATRTAAHELVARDRSEFLPADPIAFIDDQLAELADAPLVPGFNVRTTSVDPLRDAAAVCGRHDAVLEINAHCRQDEMCAVGAGETLLSDPDRLGRYVAVAAANGASVSVKVRAEVDDVDLPATVRILAEAGADYVHVDAMDSEAVIVDVADALAGSDTAVIANNGVRDEASIREYVEYGADAVSVGRPSDDPVALARVLSATRTVFREVGR